MSKLYKWRSIYWGVQVPKKTTLAKIISKKLQLKNYTLDDYVINKIHIKKGKIDLFRPDEYLQLINKIIKQHSWIIEGNKFIKRIADKAELIIYLKIGIFPVIIRLFKRFITNENQQRDKFGFRNNFNLLISIFKKYLSPLDISKINNPDYRSHKKIEYLLNNFYKNKVIFLNDNYSLNKIQKNRLNMFQDFKLQDRWNNCRFKIIWL